MSLAAVLATQHAYEAALMRVSETRAARDAAIRETLGEGVPQREIMAATDLSRARLAQIRNETR